MTISQQATASAAAVAAAATAATTACVTSNPPSTAPPSSRRSPSRPQPRPPPSSSRTPPLTPPRFSPSSPPPSHHVSNLPSTATSSPAQTPVMPPVTHIPPSRSRSRPSHHRAHPHTDPVLPRGTRVRISGNNRTKLELINRIGIVLSAQTLGGWHEVSLNDGGIVRVQRNALHVLQLPQNPIHHHGLSSSHPTNHHSTHSPRPSIAKKPHANISKLNVASLRRYRSVYNLDVSSDCSKDELLGAVKSHFEKSKVDESEVISTFLRHIARTGASPTAPE